MPITKSAQKALRQSKKRAAGNLVFKRKFKAAVKEFKKVGLAGYLEKAKSLLPTVYKSIDKASKKGVIKKNTASRYKSRLVKSLNKKQKKG